MTSGFSPDKSKFRDERNSYITQSLFIEVNYDTEKAVYSWGPKDKEYKGVIYPSLRRLYLEVADPTEYEFAERYLDGWDHWQRIVSNKLLFEQIKNWREELEVKLRSQAVRAGLSMATESFQAAKWASEGGWKGAKPGRPSKEEKAAERRIRERVADETGEDASRVISLLKERGSA